MYTILAMLPRHFYLLLGKKLFVYNTIYTAHSGHDATRNF